MPIREYRCSSCGEKDEQLMKEMKKVIKCNHCGGESHVIVSSPSRLIFKGSGFYENDYKKTKR